MSLLDRTFFISSLKNVMELPTCTVIEINFSYEEVENGY